MCSISTQFFFLFNYIICGMYVYCIRHCVIFPIHSLKELYMTGKKIYIFATLDSITLKGCADF